jgi:hypothetical protein
MALTSEELANIAKAALATRGEAGLHPSIFKGRQALQEMRSLPPAEYNAALNDQIEQIGKTITGNIPGVKGTASIGHNSPNIWFTPPGGKPQKISRAFANEIPEGSTIHTLSKEDLAKQLGGYRRDPQKETEAAAALTVRDERRMADEARAQRDAEAVAALQERDVVGERQRKNIVQTALDLQKQRDAELAAEAAATARPTTSPVPPAAREARPQGPRDFFNVSSSELPPSVQQMSRSAATERPRGPWDAPPPPPTSVPSSVMGAEEAARAANVDRRIANAVQLGIAAPFAVAAGSKVFTPERMERFRNYMNTPAGLSQEGIGSEYGNPQEGIEQALRIAKEREEARARQYQGMQAVDDADEAEKQRYLNLEGAYSREGQNTMLNPETNAWLAAPRPEAAQPSIPADGTIASQQFGTGRYAAQAERPSARPSSSSTARPSSTAPATSSPVSSGFSLGNLLGKIYDPNYQKDMSSRQLFEAAQREPENPAAFFRADKRWREENPNYQPPSDDNRKRGGAVGGTNGKDAALHKALDIIHAMMTRGHH